MSKSAEELAADLTVAWITALGSTPNGNTTQIYQLVTEQKVSQFYTAVYSTIKLLSTTPVSQLKDS